ncbi:MAG: DivIVA domain-containing protein [Desulfurivibrionaceae bacterium]
MTITPQDIQAKQFHTRMRGFDMDEVDKFLETVAEEFLVVTLENKQLLEKVETMNKELANFRNKEQAFQSAILSAQRISDEMQAKSRREAEEIVANARETADEMEQRVRREVDELLENSRREAEELTANAEIEAGRVLDNSKKEHRELTANINRLIKIKDRILTDLRQLLNNYLERIDEAIPTGLNALELLPVESEEAAPPLEEEPGGDYAGLGEDDLEDLYEKIDLADHDENPEDDEPATLDLNDIDDLEGDEDEDLAPFISMEDLNEEDEEMLFSLEDPLADLEPSISISDEDKSD